jgi:hypothetical protein
MKLNEIINAFKEIKTWKSIKKKELENGETK